MAWNYIITDRPQNHYGFPNNATEVYNLLNNKGYTHEAIIGVIANMEHESYINPGQTENFKGGDTSKGYGLVQWTPASKKILKYSSDLGLDWFRGDVQMSYFDINVPQSWIKTQSYPYTFEQFKNLDNIYDATRTFFYNFERGTYHTQLDNYAEYWNDYFGGVVPPEPPPEPPTEDDDFLVFAYSCKLFR